MGILQYMTETITTTVKRLHIPWKVYKYQDSFGGHASLLFKQNGTCVVHHLVYKSKHDKSLVYNFNIEQINPPLNHITYCCEYVGDATKKIPVLDKIAEELLTSHEKDFTRVLVHATCQDFVNKGLAELGCTQTFLTDGEKGALGIGLFAFLGSGTAFRSYMRSKKKLILAIIIICLIVLMIAVWYYFGGLCGCNLCL